MADADEQRAAGNETAKPAPRPRSRRQRILRVAGMVASVLALLVVGFVIYVETTWRRDFKDTPLVELHASKDPEVIKRGAYIAHALAHCSGCHGPAALANQHKLGENLDELPGGWVIELGAFGNFYPANLTPDPETGIGKLTDAEVGRVLRYGVGPTGQLDPIMALTLGPMADEDLVAVLSYVRSIAPLKNSAKKDEWGFAGKALSGKLNPKSFATPPFAKEGGASVERGRYLAKGPAFCLGCHSPFYVVKGYTLVGPEFSGGLEPDPDHSDPAYEIMAPNLTTDPKTGILTNFDEDQFVTRFKAGGRAVAGSGMPWENYARMTDDDLRSIYRFLKTVAPASRATGPTRRPRGSWKG